MADFIGKTIGRYHILEQLGEGGMALVFKAYDTRLEREVALKVIRRGVFAPELLDEVLKRFEREAKSLARMSHPSIVKVHDFGEHEGAPYLVLEYLPGGTLKRLLGKPMPWQAAVRLLLPVARGLAYAHGRGILHRDIKPANILITENGEPMLSDFGIAKILEGEQATSLTSSGMAVGTPEYMAPEQWKGQTMPQSDIYSLGVVLYEMVTGRKPYSADTPAAILIKQATEALPRPAQFGIDLPEAVEFLLIKALEKDPAFRFQDMNAFVTALEGLLDADTLYTGKTTSAPAVPPPTPAPVPPTVSWPAASSPLPAQTPPSQPRLSQTGSLPKAKTRFGWIAGGMGGVVVLCLVALIGIFIVWRMGSGPLRNRSGANQPAVSLPQDGSLPAEVSDARGVKMRLVPGGPFPMGSGRDEHTVDLPPFYIDQYEVTNRLYAECVRAGACQRPQRVNSATHPRYYEAPDFANFPVVWVNWPMAVAYCQWRGARLPTEAEWEKAARGAEGRRYPWGARIDRRLANYGLLEGDLLSVGSYPDGQSMYGVYDLAGNAWEWVSSLNRPYPYRPDDGRESPTEIGKRILRGGSWRSEPEFLHGAFRYEADQMNADLDIGFRCAKPAEGP
jgi:serine/threonine protein kinase